MEKKTNMPKANNPAFKMGGNQMLLCAAVLVIAVVINLIVAKLPKTVTNIDLSSDGYFTLSAQSKDFAKGLTQPVTIYLLAETGAENPTITSLLDRYAAASDLITVKNVDPVLYPGFAMGYTSATLSDNSIIVESEDRFRVVDNSEIFVADYTNYYTTGQVTTVFEGESAITSALAFVVSDNLPVVYTLEGHGETAISEKLAAEIAKSNYTLNTLNLLVNETIPGDCDTLIIAAPTTDLTDRELEAILSYMESGGSVVMFINYSVNDLPNLDILLDNYGLYIVDGIVVEQNGANYVTGYNHYLLPDKVSHEITDPMIAQSQFALMPLSVGIGEAANHRSSLSIQPLLRTSSASYSKIAGYEMTTMEKEAGDIDGRFNVGVSVTEGVTNGITKLVCYSTSLLLNDDVDSMVYNGNTSLILNTLGYTCEYENSVSIAGKALDAEVLFVTASDSNLWGVIMIIAIPALILACGIYVTRSRRKK